YLGDALTERLKTEGSIAYPTLPGAVLQAYPPFRDSDWLGLRTHKAFVAALIDHDPRLALSAEDGEALTLAAAEEEPVLLLSEAETEDSALLRSQIAAFVSDQVATSDAPLHGSSLGQSILQRFGQGVKDSGWLGAGSLSQLIADAAPEGVSVLSQQNAALFYDRDRHVHQLPSNKPEDANLANEAPDLVTFIERVAGAGWPRLSSTQHDLVIYASAELIGQGVIERNPLSAAIRDRIAQEIENGFEAESQAVSRTAINFLLNGMMLNGARFGVNCRNVMEVRAAMRESLVQYHTNRVRRPDQSDLALIDRLLSFGPDPEPSTKLSPSPQKEEQRRQALQAYN
ncbi:MAG: hypothetical protein AAF401_10725, partial [Pseudomonadota bacterium]